jgi:dynein heavy chain
MVATFKLSSVNSCPRKTTTTTECGQCRSVINAAGLLLRVRPLQIWTEDQLLLRASQGCQRPEVLCRRICLLFENIITDLFPGVERPRIDYGELLKSINDTCRKLNLQPIQPFIDKVIQLYDTIQVRHGLMVVGPTGGGKTRNFKTLSGAMTALEKKGQAKVHLHTLNPKSITMGQLYGAFNDQTHEWADGILAYMVR